MEAMMKECMKPHGLLHLLMGAGLGLILLSFFPALGSSPLTTGLIIVVAAIVGEFVIGKKKA